MDTSSINRSDLLPVATAPVAAVSVPASGKNADTATAQSIVAGKDDPASRIPGKTELRKSVDAINRFLENNSEVKFSIDDASGLSVVKVIDTETKKVIRQFPSEQSLEISKNLHSLKGLLIDSKA
ncbi:flagellar biosynthesis protein FlaG [Pseudoduganella sp. FT26W]|uniref:Flagellar biosynthesis protein FlaG n=2 Tax=Duganella TaxID=75654 RepID=A0A6L5QB45_9BURK|nr:MULTISPECIES: flagellar protein FlaG [Duganella]MRW84723.1 flagellar biosynthesis protein FlaG [Duganella aquatilis]MRX06341.1 flagellar biosynthesis protein FlaG [Duganella alba]MRX14735.1 flagellar biosynthesis protein FlaG [Duganella alba]